MPARSTNECRRGGRNAMITIGRADLKEATCAGLDKEGREGTNSNRRDLLDSVNDRGLAAWL